MALYTPCGGGGRGVGVVVVVVGWGGVGVWGGGGGGGGGVYNSKKYRGQNSATAGEGGLKEGGKKSMILKKILVRRRSKFYLSLRKKGKIKGQNSTSLKMGVKIYMAEKYGSKFYIAWKGGGGKYSTPDP